MFRLFRPTTPERLLRIRSVSTGRTTWAWVPAGCPVPTGYEEV